MFCDEFQLVDLRLFENCKKVVESCEHVFNLAADMGGMGFIQSNHSVILFNNTMISYGMLEAARQAGVKRCDSCRHSVAPLFFFPTVPSHRATHRFFYASSACIYPEYKQLDTEVEGGGLKEEDAWPAQVRNTRCLTGLATCFHHLNNCFCIRYFYNRYSPPIHWQPQDAYGLEKLASEELSKHYNKDFGMECRIARFHNIYGPYGTWKGGREKAPAAFCRKVLTSEKEFEMWGDGKQTRSFTFIDDCVEGILRITKSDFREPLNLGSSEMVRMIVTWHSRMISDCVWCSFVSCSLTCSVFGMPCDISTKHASSSPTPTSPGEHERHGRHDHAL